MKKNTTRTIKRIVGIIGASISVILFIASPSWPTPDKLFVFLLFIFLALGQSWEFLKKFTPFVVMILAYESFRGLIPQLNSRVEYLWMVHADKYLWGGNLPTVWLQDKLWIGHARWFDFGLYFIYMLHFVLPFALAILIWKKRPKFYWQYVWSFVSLSLFGFLTFLAFPAAPPWLASDKGYIEPITRISSEVWYRLGITDFTIIYNKISPNPVAAVPSLHAAYATLFSIFIFKLFGKKWGFVSLLYPVAIYFGTVYQGEHYLIDEVIGVMYAFAAFGVVSFLFKRKYKHQQVNRKRQSRVDKIVNSKEIGVSFSLLACKDYGINWKSALRSTIKLGFKRFRLMSYWNTIESVKGQYDFKDLDAQLAMIKKSGGRVSLSIGMRQPRWPETHIPSWTRGMSVAEITECYITFHRQVVERYKHHTEIESWQLENEFWLRSFGVNVDFSRKRLVKEFKLLRLLDSERPIIMTLARVASLPLRRPTPDIYGTSMYRVIYNSKKQEYTKTWVKPWVYKLKRAFIRVIKNRDLIVHELQAEPWGPKANWEMSTEEQFNSINYNQIKKAIAYAHLSGITYIDMWGAEWWYWRVSKEKDTKLYALLEDALGATG